MKKIFIIIFIFINFFAYGRKEGLPLIDSLKKELPKQKEDTNKVKILNEISYSFCQLQINFDTSVNDARIALNLSTKLGWKKGMAYADQCLGANYRSRGDGKMAMEYAKAAIEIYKEIEDKEGIAWATSDLGQVYIQLNDSAKAIEYYSNALKIQEAILDKRGMARTCINMGKFYNRYGDYSKAMDYLFKALKYNEETGYKTGMAKAIRDISAIYESQNDYAKVLEYDLKSLQLDEEIGDSIYMTNTLVDIGQMYDHLKDRPKALEYFLKAFRIVENGGDYYRQSVAAADISDIYEKMNDYRLAIKYILLSLKLSETRRDTFVIALNVCNIGNLFLDMYHDTSKAGKLIPAQGDTGVTDLPPGFIPSGRPELLNKAREYFEQCLQLCKRAGWKSWIEIIKECNEKLAEIYTLQGDYKKANKALIVFHALKDSLFEERNTAKLENIEIRNEYEKRRLTDSLNAKLEKENLEWQSNLKTYILLGCILIVLMATFFIYRNNRQKQKATILILAEKDIAVQQRLRAEKSEQFKQQFLANMSHEIRTPMNAVMGMTNLLLETPLQEKQNFYLGIIRKSSDNLLHIINDILDLSKIEAGKMELEQIDFSLSSVVDQVKQTMDHRAEEKGLQLLTQIDPAINDVVIGDPVRLNQVLINLTGNAIKFTEKGSVTIELKKENKSAIRFRL